MSATTSHNRWQRVMVKVRDAHFNAVHFRWRHKHLLDEMGKIYASDDYKRLTRYYQGCIAGWLDCWRDSVAHRKTVWAHRFGGCVGYVRVASWDQLTESERQQCRDNTVESTHIWEILGEPQERYSAGDTRIAPWGEWSTQ